MSHNSILKLSEKCRNTRWLQGGTHVYSGGVISEIYLLEGLCKNPHIADNCKVTACDLGGLNVIRAYASYTTGITHKVDAPISRIARLLKGFEAAGGDIGHLMIGCGANVLKNSRAPFPLFPNIPIEEDIIRPFNYLAAKAGIVYRKKTTENRRRGVAKGFYLLEQMDDPDYSWPLNPSPEIPAKNYVEDLEGGVGCGLVQSALNYKSAEDRSERITL